MSRKFMMRGVHALAQINRARKLWICRKQVQHIVEKAFTVARRFTEDEACYRIQRVLRGHRERSTKQQLVLDAVRKKVELKQDVCAKKIQKRLKGRLVRKRIEFLAHKVSVPQAHVRMRWTRRIY